MEPEQQSRAFEPDSKTKIIFATNVAETSVTINGVRTVIDSGRVKERCYDQTRNISILKLQFITQSSARQRRGRAGRCQPGQCYRLYTQQEYDQMEPFLMPEILRMHIGLVVLQLLACGMQTLTSYDDLIDRPDQTAVATSIDKLTSLQLLQNGQITEYGLVAADLYLEPSISRMIIEALRLQLGDLVIKIAAMMTITNCLYNRSLTNEQKNIQKLSTSSCHGDFVTLLKIYTEYEQTRFRQRPEWCATNKYSLGAMKLACQAYYELYALIKRSRMSSCLNKIKRFDMADEGLIERLLECISAGLHGNIAYRNGRQNGLDVYTLFELKQEAFVHPESVLQGLGETDVDLSFVIFSDLIRTDKLYMKNVTPVRLETVAKYSQKDYRGIERSVKEPLRRQINPKISNCFKERNRELLERLEEELGHTVWHKHDQLETFVPRREIENANRLVERTIKIAESRLANEVKEFKTDDVRNGRVIVRAGFQVHTILISGEFIRINFADFDGNDKALERRFSAHGKLIDLTTYRATGGKLNGFVIFDKSQQARQAFESLRDVMSLNPSVITDDRSCSRNTTVKAYWFLTQPTGTAFIKFKDGSNLADALLRLYHMGYKGKIETQINQVIYLLIYFIF